MERLPDDEVELERLRRLPDLMGDWPDEVDITTADDLARGMKRRVVVVSGRVIEEPTASDAEPMPAIAGAVQ